MNYRNYGQPYPFGAGYQAQPYQPMMGGQPYAPQSVAPQQPFAQTPPPITNVSFTTPDEAKGYILMPNTRALLIDRQGGVAWLKTANSVGESFCQFFKFEEVNADGTPLKPQEQTPQVDLSAFIKREDLPALGFSTKEDYKILYEKIEALQKQIAGGSVDE